MIVTFDEYCELAVHAMTANTHWRRGQAYSNILWNIQPYLWKEAKERLLDPFAYDEGPRIDIFLEWLRENWNSEKKELVTT